MNPISSEWNAQLQALTESNETLLKSKAKLQQDLLAMKKEISRKEQLLADQAAINQEQAAQLEESRRIISELRTIDQDQQDQIGKLTTAMEQLRAENQRLQARSWFQRLLERK